MNSTLPRLFDPQRDSMPLCADWKRAAFDILRVIESGPFWAEEKRHALRYLADIAQDFANHAGDGAKAFPRATERTQ